MNIHDVFKNINDIINPSFETDEQWSEYKQKLLLCDEFKQAKDIFPCWQFIETANGKLLICQYFKIGTPNINGKYLYLNKIVQTPPLYQKVQIGDKTFIDPKPKRELLMKGIISEVEL